MRFWPTPGRSALTSIPCEHRCAAGPTPESINKCGLPTAPALNTTSRRAVAVTHDLITPNGASLAAGAGFVRLGRSYTLIIPANASGATLLAVTARDSSGGTIIAKQTFRMLVGAPLPPSHSARRRGFAFGSTIEWHVQAALLGSGLLEQQLAARRGIGLVPFFNLTAPRHDMHRGRFCSYHNQARAPGHTQPSAHGACTLSRAPAHVVAAQVRLGRCCDCTHMCYSAFLYEPLWWAIALSIAKRAAESWQAIAWSIANTSRSWI